MFDTTYSGWEGPERQPVLDGEVLNLSAEETASIASLASVNPVAVRAAHVYERSGFFAADDFAQEFRNSSYGSQGDDIVVQLTMVVRRHEDEGYETMKGIYASVQQARAEAAVAAREAELSAQEAEVAAAQAALVAAQERLAKARGEA